MSLDKVHLSIGSVRMANERRQYGGLLMVTGFCAVIFPLNNLSSAMSSDGLSGDFTDPSTIPFWSFVGGCCLLAIGVAAVITGFTECVNDSGATTVTNLTIILTQTAFIPYITDMVNVGKTGTKEAPQFWNQVEDIGAETAAEMTNVDVHFMAAMGIMGIMSYGFTFVGSIAFMQFSLYAFQNSTPEERHSSYFASRLGFYSLVLCLAGISQLMLGTYLLTNFDISEGKLSGGFVSVGPYTVVYPSMSMLVGALQIINGLWGFARSLDVAHGGPDDIIYGCSMAFQWMTMIVIQFICQIGYLPSNTKAAAAPTMAAMSFGLNLMTAFLDYKMRNTLEDIPVDYYGCSDEYEYEKERERALEDDHTRDRPHQR